MEKKQDIAAHGSFGRLKICVIEPAGELYGSEYALLDLLERLDSVRFAPEVILPSGSAFSESLKKRGIPIKEILPAKSSRNSKFSKALAYTRIAVGWRMNPPDLIYVNQGGILRPIAHIAKRLRIPLICQVQTLEDARWVSELRNLHDSVNGFICNSDFIASNCVVPKDSLSMLYYGYKTKGLQPTIRSTPRKPFEIGLLGRISESKGHFLVIDAVERLKASSVDDLHFRFIGDAPCLEDRIHVQNLVESKGLGGLIEFRGYRSDISKELQDLDLMIIPSLSEPFGRIYCEAAEARLPVLVSDGGGLGELADHFRAGVTFKSGDVCDFLDKLSEIRNDYTTVSRAFVESSLQMLVSLNIDAYVRVIENILVRAANREKVSICWLGEK